MKLHAVAAAALLSILPAVALAGTTTLTLTRGSLNNVNDAAGIWQIEGGQVFTAGRQIGDYACTRRTVTVGTGGTGPQNVAMLTCTLFVNGAHPPENITFQGAHDYGSGGYSGSVSAASGSYSFLRGATVSGSSGAGTVILTW